MDLTSVIGLGLSFAFLIYGIVSGGPISSFIDLPSVYITVGGSISAAILGSSKEQLKNVGKIFKIAFTKQAFDPNETIKQIVELSYVARKEGLLSLENKAEEIGDSFFKKGILLAVDGMEGHIIRDVLGAEIDAMEKRHKEGRGIMDLSAVLFPAFGMIGTLIGLINMLKDLSSPDKIGPQMAIALVTTFYGAIMSNILFIPISKKLKAKTEQEVIVKEMIIEGVIAIQSGENTRFVEQKLLSYISPKNRAEILGGAKDEQK